MSKKKKEELRQQAIGIANAIKDDPEKRKFFAETVMSVAGPGSARLSDLTREQLIDVIAQTEKLGPEYVLPPPGTPRDFTPGVFRMIDKHEIHIDTDWQRSQTTRSKTLNIDRIVREFTFYNFGTICVHENEPDSQYLYECIDGAGRVTAARQIDEIIKVPCMVFSGLDARGKARSFVDQSLNAVALTWMDRYRAGILAGDERFLRMREFIEAVERRAESSTSPETVSCLSKLYNYCMHNRGYLRLMRLAPLLREVFSGYGFESTLLQAIMYLDDQIEGYPNLSAALWPRITKYSAAQLMRAGRSYQAEMDIRTNLGFLQGCLRLINKGFRTNKIRLRLPK